MESKLWLWELGQTPCSHPLYQGTSSLLQEFGCALWPPWQWLLFPPCPFPCPCSLFWHSLCCRNSFPEMHVSPGAPVTFRNVPLPRIKQNKYYLVPYLFSCLLMHTCLQPWPMLRPANISQLLHSISGLQGHFSLSRAFSLEHNYSCLLLFPP